MPKLKIKFDIHKYFEILNPYSDRFSYLLMKVFFFVKFLVSVSFNCISRSLY